MTLRRPPRPARPRLKTKLDVSNDFDPTASAQRLFLVLRNPAKALFGVDVEAAWRETMPLTKADYAALRTEYKNQNDGADLDADLRENLKGLDLDRANHIIAGNKHATLAVALKTSLSKQLGGSSEEILGVLTSTSAADLKKVAEEYKLFDSAGPTGSNGADALTFLERDLSHAVPNGEAKTWLEAARAVGTQKAPSAELQAHLNGILARSTTRVDPTRRRSSLEWPRCRLSCRRSCSRTAR